MLQIFNTACILLYVSLISLLNHRLEVRLRLQVDFGTPASPASHQLSAAILPLHLRALNRAPAVRIRTDVPQGIVVRGPATTVTPEGRDR